MKDWIPTLVAGIAIVASFANFLFSLRLNRQKAVLDQKMKRFEADLNLLSQEKSAAATGHREQLNREIEDIFAAVAAAQKVKDRTRSILTAITNPGSLLKVSALTELSTARKDLETCHEALARWLSLDERRALHAGKNRGVFVAGLLQREVDGQQFIEGASDQVKQELEELLSTLGEAQASLRDLAATRQSRLNIGLNA